MGLEEKSEQRTCFCIVPCTSKIKKTNTKTAQVQQADEKAEAAGARAILDTAGLLAPEPWMVLFEGTEKHD